MVDGSEWLDHRTALLRLDLGPHLLHKFESEAGRLLKGFSGCWSGWFFFSAKKIERPNRRWEGRPLWLLGFEDERKNRVKAALENWFGAGRRKMDGWCRGVAVTRGSVRLIRG